MFFQYHHHIQLQTLLLVLIVYLYLLEFMAVIKLIWVQELKLHAHLVKLKTFSLSQCSIQIFTAPTSSVSNITISSIQARSMIVSWDEVPCSGQNGAITGYLLYYTNGTFSDTIYITGGSYRQHILTTITPHTNYTVTVTAYNDGGIGPVSSGVTQQTKQAGKLVIALI